MLAGAEAGVWTARMLYSVRRRLRSLLLKQRMKRSHIGQGLGLSRLWPNAYFAEHGLFALHEAWAAARQSR